jgi:hypothetical protein
MIRPPTLFSSFAIEKIGCTGGEIGIVQGETADLPRDR